MNINPIKNKIKTGKTYLKWLTCIILSAILLVGCQKDGGNQKSIEPITKSDFVLGTITSITLYTNEETAKQVFEAIFERLRNLEEKLSLKLKESELNKVNNYSGRGAIKVSEDTYRVIAAGADIAIKSQGAFDPTIGPVVQLWDIGGDNQRVPTQQELNHALRVVDYKKVKLNEAAKTVELTDQGMELDLGGIGKGYAADEIVKILNNAKIKSGIINLGGNVLIHGSKDGNKPFKVGIQDPLSDRGEYLGIVSVSDQTVVSSGIYERFFKEGNTRYHHILDGVTGYPVDNELVAVSIITKNSMVADGLSTAVFSMGLKGREFIDTLDEVEAIFITKDNKVYVTAGIEESFQLTNDLYGYGD